MAEDRIPPYRLEKYSIKFPGGQGIVGYPNDAEMAQAIADALEGIDLSEYATEEWTIEQITQSLTTSLSQEQIDAIIAAIPDSPVTEAQITALQEAIDALTGAVDGKANEDGIATTVAYDIAASEPGVLTNWMRLILTSPDFVSWQENLLQGLPQPDAAGLTVLDEEFPEPPPYGDRTPADYQNIWNRTLPGRYLYLGTEDARYADPVLLTLGRDDSGTRTYLHVQRASGSEWYSLTTGANSGSTIVKFSDGALVALQADGQAKPFYVTNSGAFADLAMRGEIIPNVASVDDIPDDAEIGQAFLVGDDKVLYVVMADGAGTIGGGVESAAQPVTFHKGLVPQPVPPITPEAVLALWRPYEPGLHLFEQGGAKALVILGRQVDEDDGGEQIDLRMFLPDSTVTATIRDWDNGSSRLMIQQGMEFLVLEATKGDKPMLPTQTINLGDVYSKFEVDTLLADAQAAGLTQDQIDAIIAAIPGTPVTAAQVEALEQQVGYFTSLNIQGTFEVLAEWRLAVEGLFATLGNDKAEKAELQALSDYLNTLNIENTLQALDGWKEGVEQAIIALDADKAAKDDLTQFQPKAWVNLTLGAGYVTEPTRPLSARMTPDGEHIEFRGVLMRDGEVPFDVDKQIKVATLPADIRPATWVYGQAHGWTKTTDVASIGVVNPRQDGTVWLTPVMTPGYKYYFDGVRIATFKGTR